MTDFVLLHGTTQSPAGWDRLSGTLAARGHRCWSADLESSTDRTPEDYAQAVRTAMPVELDSPVVVAHSGAGLLLPAVARAVGARQQVWLTAAVPDGKRSLVEELSRTAQEVFHEEWIGQDPTQDPVLATYFLFHDCDLPTLQWALGTVRLFVPERAYREPVALSPEIASTYIVGTRDRTLRPAWCREAARTRLDAKIVELDAGHCPHVSRPEELADLLTA